MFIIIITVHNLQSVTQFIKLTKSLRKRKRFGWKCPEIAEIFIKQME